MKIKEKLHRNGMNSNIILEMNLQYSRHNNIYLNKIFLKQIKMNKKKKSLKKMI